MFWPCSTVLEAYFERSRGMFRICPQPKPLSRLFLFGQVLTCARLWNSKHKVSTSTHTCNTSRHCSARLYFSHTDSVLYMPDLCQLWYLVSRENTSLYCVTILYTRHACVLTAKCKSIYIPSCCSDFRYESNGIFVLGGGFFLQTNFDFLTSHFWRNFFISFKRYCCRELKFEKIYHLWSFFVKLWGFKDCHFGHFDQFGTINAI